MDGNTFDHLTRSVTVNPTRRNVMRLVSGSAIAGLIGTLYRPDISVGKKKKNKKKKNKKPCPTCETCPSGCVTGTEPCDGECRPICASTEVRNPATCECVPCQAVGAACSGERCCSGVCGCTAAGCVCREADCIPTGGDCTGLGNLDCCQGVCSGVCSGGP